MSFGLPLVIWQTIPRDTHRRADTQCVIKYLDRRKNGTRETTNKARRDAPVVTYNPVMGLLHT